MTEQRFDVLAVGCFGLVGDAQHGRLRRTIDVGVEHANARAFGGQRQREVDGDGGLADAALAGSDRNDVLDVGDHLDATLHAVRNDLETDVDAGVADAVDAFERGLDLLLDGIQLALRRIAQQNIERDGIAVDLEVANGFGREVIFVRIGVEQRFQCGLHLNFRNSHDAPLD